MLYVYTAREEDSNWIYNETAFIVSGGSLGSWIDEGRSQLRYLMRIADTLSIETLNAHCGIGIPVRMPCLAEGCIEYSQACLFWRVSENEALLKWQVLSLRVRWTRLNTILTGEGEFVLLALQCHVTIAFAIVSMERMSLTGFSASAQSWLLAELKHINRQRKRN